jgi:hypothetical protein
VEAEAIVSQGTVPNIGPYRNVGGHHIHQSASFSEAAATANPNHRAAISIEQNVPEFTGPQHDLASAAQRNINRAYRGDTVNQPTIGTLQIHASGEGTKAATASMYFEDIKAFYALRAAGFGEDTALFMVNLSRSQIEQAGVLPVRVPTK